MKKTPRYYRELTVKNDKIKIAIASIAMLVGLINMAILVLRVL